MKKFLLSASLALLCTVSAFATEITVASPEGKLIVTVSYDRAAPLTYTVYKGGVEVLAPSPLGLVVDGKNTGEKVSGRGKPVTTTIQEEYPLFGNHPVALNRCRQVSIPLSGNGIAYRLEVRAYDDGMALRYVFQGQRSMKIERDLTGWRLPAGATCYWADYTLDYEEPHHATPFSQVPTQHPVVVPFTAEAGGRFIAISEADARMFPDMVVQREGDLLRACWPSVPRGWTARGPIASSWRAMIVADDLTELVNSDLITNLCEAPAAGLDFSWVKPGRALWQWWSVGSPLFEDQKAWYDAAARLGWEYYLIDEGWRQWRDGSKDQWACLKEMIDYGKSVGVESLVWVNSNEMRTRDSIRLYLEKIKPTGAAGVKIDFIPEGTPAIMRWYQDALEETARLGLLCNFHGCVKPSGLRRTWPHELTREAVRGNEFHISRYERVMPKDQDVLKPFTRLLAGPADMTPVTFVPSELLGYTWPHELAQAVVYLSPITHFSDQYKYYLNSPVEDLLRDIPVIWDETRVLSCSKIGEVAAYARRKGSEWWIGVLNGAKNSDIALDLSFLKAPMMGTEIADRQGVDDAVVRHQRMVFPNTAINLSLRPGGGYLLRLQPAATE